MEYDKGRPMEDAPTDGTPILVEFAGDRYSLPGFTTVAWKFALVAPLCGWHLVAPGFRAEDEELDQTPLRWWPLPTLTPPAP